MEDREKVITYELHIEDMLNVLKERLVELDNNPDLDEFQQGQQLAYKEMLDIIKTRHQMIWEMFEDGDDG